METNNNFKRFFVVSGQGELEVCAKDEKEAMEIASLYFRDFLDIKTKEITHTIYSTIN